MRMKPASLQWLRESNKVFDEEVAFQERFRDPESGLELLELIAHITKGEAGT